MSQIQKSDFFFELSEQQIAKYPLTNRDQSKLLCYREGQLSHHIFTDIESIIPSDALLVMNNAKVIPARLYFKRRTGAQIEVLLLEPILPSSYEEMFTTTSNCQWKCMIRNSKKWKEGEDIELLNKEGIVQAKLVNRQDRIVKFSWESGVSFSLLLNQIGELPLPPYLNRKTEYSDQNTYQTVFAKHEGSVAAPTAGLHFTSAVLQQLSSKGVITDEVTLHVGAGTFLPIKTSNVVDHDMHREYFEVSFETIERLINNSNRFAVGTTSLRVLESLYWIGVQLSLGKESFTVSKLMPYQTKTKLTYTDSLKKLQSYMKSKGLEKIEAATEILILPHYNVQSIQGLITNFHLPESTLLLLVASIVGNDWKKVYDSALANDYRFLSYGDSSILFVK